MKDADQLSAVCVPMSYCLMREQNIIVCVCVCKCLCVPNVYFPSQAQWSLATVLRVAQKLIMGML